MQGLRLLRALLKGGRIDPLPATTFAAANTPDARDMASLSSSVGCRLVRLCKLFDLWSLLLFNALESVQADWIAALRRTLAVQQSSRLRESRKRARVRGTATFCDRFVDVLPHDQLQPASFWWLQAHREHHEDERMQQVKANAAAARLKAEAAAAKLKANANERAIAKQLGLDRPPRRLALRAAASLGESWL